MTTDTLDKLKEKLADIEHQRWADWQKWCHEVLPKEVGAYHPSLEKVLERWDRQIATPYEALSEAEKDSDRQQVDRYWTFIEAYIAKHRLQWADPMSDYTKVTIKKTVAEQGKIQATAENRSLANYVEWLIQTAPNPIKHNNTDSVEEKP